MTLLRRWFARHIADVGPAEVSRWDALDGVNDERPRSTSEVEIERGVVIEMPVSAA